MKKTKMKPLWIACFVVLATIVLCFLAFGGNKAIEKTVEVNVYTEDEIIESSSITISGNIKDSFLTSEYSFVGTFAMEYYEKSCRDDVKAKIEWFDSDYQNITFYNAGDFSRLDVDEIEINKQMDSIMVSFVDGTIIATPDIEIDSLMQMDGF